MEKNKISIDDLIHIVRSGGSVKTGIDVYNQSGVLLLEKNVRVKQEKTLLRVKESGIKDISIYEDDKNGIWDKSGKRIS